MTDVLYTGYGVKVGIIENLYPDNCLNFNAGLYEMSEYCNNCFYDFTIGVDSHASIVGSIIGGSTGIASDAYLMFIHNVCYSGNTTEHFEVLINNDANIINCSFGSGNATYLAKSAYYDTLVRNTHVSMFVSSGNDDVNKYVTDAGTALNVITVGSCNVNKQVSYFSSYVSSYCNKPDIVAPGENLDFIGSYNNATGTSFSSPFATGICALLMEEYPFLKLYPEIVKTVLKASANKLPTQIDKSDDQWGYGIINYQNARAYLDTLITNCSFQVFNTPANANNGDLIKALYLYLPGQSEINIYGLWNSMNETLTYEGSTPLTPNYSDYIIYLNDTTNNNLLTINSTNNSCIGKYINNLNYELYCSILIYLNSQKCTNNAERGVISFEILNHSHYYTDNYVYFNTIKHKSYCECNLYILEMHTFTAMGRYKICNYCGYTIDLWNDPNPYD